HHWLVETSHIHIAAWAAWAARAIRSLCWRKDSFERFSPSIRTASNVSGVALIKRKNCRASAFSAGVWWRNGPWPRMVPDIARKVISNIETLSPPRPKRSTAQMRRGMHAYKRGGEALG